MYMVTLHVGARHYPDCDKVVNKVKRIEDSGMGFGERDYAWYYKKEEAAKALKKRLRAALTAAKMGGKIEIIPMDEEDM